MRTPASIFFVLGAFILSAWSNVIAASFCPSYLARNCSIQHVDKAKSMNESSCHHQMADMGTADTQMDDMQTSDSTPEAEATLAADKVGVAEVTESALDQSALETPNEPCGHCWMHSQPPQGSVTLAGINPSPRSVEAPAPSALTAIALPYPNPIATEPSEHSPPGNSFPRHILINVLRI